MTTNIQQFKQQTFALIKQQATKLKTHAKQIEIKQQQIRFLKQTIQTLEEERDQCERVKNNLKNKIDMIMKEVSNYNDNVVQKLHSDNQILNKKIIEIEPNLQVSLQTIKRLTKQLQSNQEKMQKLIDQSNKNKQITIQERKDAQKLKVQYKILKQQVAEQQKYIFKLEAQKQQLQNKLKSNDKQIDSLVSKCQDTVNNCQKKMKNLKDGLVKKQQLIKIQQILQRQTKKYEEQKKQKQKLLREKNEITLNLKIYKQRQISNQMKNQIQNSLIQADFRNFKDSCKICKRISQFESKYSNLFYQIFETFYSINLSKQQYERKSQILQQKLLQFQRILSQKQRILQQSRNQIQIMSEKLRIQSQTIESSYEGKILQLSIKIKKQEKALQQLSIKDRQFQTMHEQYEKLVQEHLSVKQTLQNTINQYKKQNNRLSTQVQQLIQLCDQNINTKNSLNSLKHCINNLLTVICYLHLNLIRSRQARRKLYQPFMDFYFKTKQTVKDHKKKEQIDKKPINKLRSCVIMIIAIKRMEKGAKQASGSGLYRYVEKAIKTKTKIEDLSQYLEILLQKSIKNEKNVGDLIKESKSVYKWNSLQNYLKLNISTNWYQNILSQ